jgi:thiamine-monophosphate kinase
MVEGRHWLAGQDMADVAWKLVAVNLSDLAAKGAAPQGILLGHTLGDGDARFLAGLREVLEAYQVRLLGGDTVAGDGARTLGCTAIGRALHTPVPARSGAQPGNAIYVTGPVGAAMLGFEALRDRTGGQSLVYRRPAPLLAEGQALAPYVTAMMDISDGLLLDAWRMARASGVTFELGGSEIPVAAPDRRDECLRWGDDYQLLFTAPVAIEIPVGAHRIGTVEPAGTAPLVLDSEEISESTGLGYQHG